MNYKTLTPEQRKAVLERLIRAGFMAEERSGKLKDAERQLYAWHGLSEHFRVDLNDRGAYKLGEFLALHSLMVEVMERAQAALTEVELEIAESIDDLKGEA